MILKSQQNIIELVTRSDIYQCTRGHLICLDCAKKVARCPMCRELYKRPMTRNVVAEDLVRGQRGWNCHYLAELDLSCISCGEVSTFSLEILTCKIRHVGATI